MRANLLLLLTFFLLMLSCDEDDTLSGNCLKLNSSKNLDWLRIEIENLEQIDSEWSQYFYVSQAEYEGSPIIIFGNCCPTCLTTISAYNCEGDYVGRLGCGEDYIDFSILDNDVLIWKPDN